MYSIVSSPPIHMYRYFLIAGASWGAVGGWILGPAWAAATSDVVCGVVVGGGLGGVEFEWYVGVSSTLRLKSFPSVNNVKSE